MIIYMTDNGPEGAGEFGKLSNPSVNTWLKERFSGNVEDIGDNSGVPTNRSL